MESVETVIVMGGSFNPPTRAHLELMLKAKREIGDMTGGPVRGVFVPSGEAYLRKKRAEGRERDSLILPEGLRLAMLEAFGTYDPDLSVDGRELGTDTVRGHTLGTLCAIREENPGSEVCFLMGGDKLRGFPGWKYFEELVSSFRIIVYDRDGAGCRSLISGIPELERHRESFTVLEAPDGAAHVSSGKVRRALERGEMPEGMLTPEVRDMLLRWSREEAEK